MRVNWLGGTIPRIDNHARRRGLAISSLASAVDPDFFQIPATLAKSMRWLYSAKEWSLSFNNTWAYDTRLVWINSSGPPPAGTHFQNSELNYSGHSSLDDLRSNVRFKPQSGPNIDLDFPYKLLDERVQGSGFFQTIFGNLGTTFPKEGTTTGAGVLIPGDADYHKFSADISVSGGGSGVLTSYELHPYLGIWEPVFTTVTLVSAVSINPLLFLNSTGINNKRVRLPSDFFGKEMYALNSAVPVEIHPNVFVWLTIGYNIQWTWHVDWVQSGAWPYDPGGDRHYDTDSGGIRLGTLPTGIPAVGCVNPPGGFSVAAQTQAAATGRIDVPGAQDVDGVGFQMKYVPVQGQTGVPLIDNTLTISNWDLALEPTDFFDYS